jgi:hypothetical protein
MCANSHCVNQRIHDQAKSITAKSHE